jgi:hypothetical protein
VESRVVVRCKGRGEIREGFQSVGRKRGWGSCESTKERVNVRLTIIFSKQ